MENKIVKKMKVSGLSLGVLLIAACGSDSNEEIPPGAVVEISPQEVEWLVTPTYNQDSSCVAFAQAYQDELVTIRILDSGGRALGGVETVSSLSLAENTSGDLVTLRDQNGQPIPIVSLYEDRNGNFLADEDELVSEEGEPLFISESDEYTGVTTVIVRMNLSCPYRARLSVVAAGATASVTFRVAEE